MSGTINKLWAFDAPTLTADCNAFQLGTHGHEIVAPIPVFLIEHDNGLMLFDTGLDNEAAGNPAQVYGPLAAAFGIDFPEELRLDAQLESIGLRTTDIDRIVLSHLHFDHTGGLALFPGSQGFIGTEEMRYARTPRSLDAHVFSEKDLTAAGRIDWLEVPKGYDHDVYGDGSVVILSLPGHTPGSLGLRLRLPDGNQMVLTSDAAHLRSNYEQTTGIPIDVHNADRDDSLRKLKLISTQPNATVWVSHDPQDWEQNRPAGSRIV